MKKKNHPITPELLAASTVIQRGDDLLGSEFWCGACGDPFEVGQQALEIYSPEFDAGKHRAVEDIHLCCYQGEEVRT